MTGRGSQNMAKDHSGDERYNQAFRSLNLGDSTVAQPASQKYEGDNDLHSNDGRGMGETALSANDPDVPAPHVSSDSDERYRLQKPFSSSSQDNPDVSHHDGATAGSHATGIQPEQSDGDIQIKSTKTFAGYFNMDVNTAKIKETEAEIEIKMQNLLMGDRSTLQTFLEKILTDGPPDFGYFIWEKLHTRRVGELWKYETPKDFDAKVIKPNSVFLCRDRISDELFVLKRIKRGENRKRLVGIEFLLEQDEKFLPKIYGVYKESDTFSIFQEYVDGGTLLHCNWNMEEIRNFAEELLNAISFLHKRDLVHFDIKLNNLMLRDVSNGTELVLIDFESAKRKRNDFKEGGYTINYLPPWHEDLLKLKSYEAVLKTADLWAIACVIIFFLLRGERSELARDRREVWSDEMSRIRSECPKCRVNCSRCKKHMKNFVKENGKNILQSHLSHLLDKEIDDPNWQALHKLLLYLTDTKNIEGKHIDMALDLIKVERAEPHDNMEEPSGDEPGNP